jgi:hypothetical protein
MNGRFGDAEHRLPAREMPTPAWSPDHPSRFVYLVPKLGLKKKLSFII